LGFLKVSNPFRELGALQRVRRFYRWKRIQWFQTPFGNWVRCNENRRAADKRLKQYRFKPLSGIGCVATRPICGQITKGFLSFKPLSGIGCVATKKLQAPSTKLNEGFKPLSGIGCVATTGRGSHCRTGRRRFQTPFGNWVRCNAIAWQFGRNATTCFKPLSGIGCVATYQNDSGCPVQGWFQTPFGNWVRCN